MQKQHIYNIDFFDQDTATGRLGKGSAAKGAELGAFVGIGRGVLRTGAEGIFAYGWDWESGEPATWAGYGGLVEE